MRPSIEGDDAAGAKVEDEAAASRAELVPPEPARDAPPEPRAENDVLPTSWTSAVLQTLPMLLLAAVGLLLSGRELDRISVRRLLTRSAGASSAPWTST